MWEEKTKIIQKYFNYYLFTGHTVRPNSQCEQHRDSLQSGVGAFIPQCDSDGRYRPLQVGADS